MAIRGAKTRWDVADRRGEGLRRGMTLLECTVALVILSLAMLGLVQLLAAASGQRRLTEARRMAMQEVANQAERIAAMPWDAAAPDKLTGWSPSQDLAAAIPGATCRAQATDETGPPAARRIRLEVGWSDPAGRSQQPVVLTVWKFQPEAQP
jgi:prepilin-type N-terminal cleavage/methylation domain-containing protein